MFTTDCLYANPSPFGLEIGKATLKEVQAKYKIKKVGINAYSGGEMYDVAGIKFDELRKTRIIFSKDGKLLAIICIFPNNKFSDLLDDLKEKYHLVTKKIPFMGDKHVEFVDDDTSIVLNAPHMTFLMAMQYVHKEFTKRF